MAEKGGRDGNLTSECFLAHDDESDIAVPFHHLAASDVLFRAARWFAHPHIRDHLPK